MRLVKDKPKPTKRSMLIQSGIFQCREFSALELGSVDEANDCVCDCFSNPGDLPGCNGICAEVFAITPDRHRFTFKVSQPGNRRHGAAAVNQKRVSHLIDRAALPFSL